MTSTDLLLAGVIAALFAPAARLNEMKAAFGVMIVCVAFATTIEVMMATTVARRMTPGRENFWIRILIAFILFGFLLFGFSLCLFLMSWSYSLQSSSARNQEPSSQGALKKRPHFG
jgi:protein-S-isoprenylcysteine O-methyltransferase Ste14